MASARPARGRDPWLGRVVDRRYRVEQCIGRGGMGTVYKVVHVAMGKIAAMKLLHGSLAQDRELIQRFHQEAAAISKLDHPNIVQVFDFGRVDNSMYLVMEYLKGQDLSAILRDDGPMPVARCLPILVQICNALTEAHEVGIVHRDLKPENIRISVTREGNDFVKVLDFGLAKIMIEDEQPMDQEAPVTARGSLVGTPYYMAPEMIRAKPLDHRVDIYSLGAMAYRMVTSENAFIAKTPMAVLTKHITEEVMPPSKRKPQLGIPPAVDRVVLRAMTKDRRKRYLSAEEMKRDLLEAMHSLHIQDTSTAPYLDGSIGYPGRTVNNDPGGSYHEDLVSSAPRLSKDDLAFERKLRRGRLLGWLIPLPLIAGVAFAVYWLGFRQVEPLAPNAEIEPNNGPPAATLLAPNKLVSGQLGRRLSLQESDRDWYQFEIAGDKPQAIWAKVTGLTNMDIVLELFDGAGGRLTKADSSGKSGGEILARWVVDPGKYYLMVREVWVDGVPPTENVTDKYALVARWLPAGTGWELEPNDTAAKAQQLKPGQSLNGHISPAADVDVFRLTPQKGYLAGMVQGIEGADLVLEVLRKKEQDANKPLSFNKQPVSAGEGFTQLKVDGKNPVLVRVRRANHDKPAPGQDARGIDLPYSLKVWPVEKKSK